MSKYEILKVRDPSDKNHIKIPVLADLPFKLAIVGKSQVSLGKTTIILNLFLRDKYYKNYFDGINIYIVSNNSVDKKLKILMEELDIPESNFMQYDEDKLEALYDILEEEHIEEKKKLQKLIIFDDVAYSNGLKGSQTGVISKIVMNGRHILLNSIFTTQKYSLLGTNLRSQLTGIFVGSTSTKELELIETDMNYLDNKKEFMKLMRDNTKGRNFVFINFTNTDDQGMYLNSNFEKIA
jgi:hypothetical protein